MTVESQISRADYTGNGATTNFAVPFYFLDNTHLRVLRTDNTTSPAVVTTLVLNVDYTVAGAAIPGGGSITLSTAPTAQMDIAILRNVPLTQLTEYVPNDPFPAKSHERALDKLTMELQQLAEQSDRALTLPPQVTGASTELPTPEPLALLGWNPDGDALQNVDPTTLATTVAFGTARADLFSGNGVQKAFTLTANPGAQANLDVIVGGAGQRAAIDYVWSSGTTVTFTTAPPTGVNNIQIRYFQGLPFQDSALRLDLTSSANPTLGAGIPAFDFSLAYAQATVGWGLQTCGNSFNFWRLIPPAEWPAIVAGTSTYDVTALLTTAIATYKDVFVPPGVYSVDPDVGVRLVGSMRLRGAGQNQTIFAATAQGGTLAELAGHAKGSVFKRAFTPGVANARLDTVHLSDFAVVLNHPTASVTATEIQIGIDLRHVGRSQVERVWVGNIAPLGGRMVKADPGAYAAQGYGIVIGNVDTGNIAYCGGEVHSIVGCSVFGAYKLVVQDDATLSPLSGAHAVTVAGCDLQGGHHLLVQEQQYTAGNVWDGNTLQDIRRKPGDASATHVMRVAGYDNDIGPGYIEAGTADYLLRFDSASDNNRARLTHYSATTIGIAAFSDGGRRNRVECRTNAGLYPSGVDSKGTPVVRYDRSYEEMSVVAHYDGVSAMVKDGGLNLTVTRPTGAGDYLFTYGLPVIDANAISIEISYDTNASGHGGTHAVISKGTTNIRIQFYAQNGATTTAIDPRFIFVKIKQVVTQ